MAIKANFKKIEQNFDGALIAKDAYWKIDKFSGNKLQCRISVGAYTQQNGTLLGSKEYYFVPVMDENNFIKQAYQHLKTLPEFEGSMDC
jgi:hypothetical protein